MAAVPGQSILLKGIQQGISPPSSPEQGQEQEQDQTFNSEIPEIDFAMDFKLDLGFWKAGTGETATKRLEPLSRNGNASDFDESVDRPEPSNGKGNTSDSGTGVEYPETSMGDYITSSSEAAVKRPCDYILTRGTASRWFQGRNSYPPYQQVGDIQCSIFTQKGIDAEAHVVALDYLAAFIIEIATLEHERENIGVSQVSQLLAKQDRMKELVKRARGPLHLVRECCDDLDLFMDLVDEYGRP